MPIMGNSVSPTRRQRPRGSITREAVVFAALAVVDRQGPQALTIRSVARQVGAPPMSLYTHFANKDELMDLMVSEIVRHLYRDNGNATWQSELEALCRRIYAVLLEHPNWTPLLSRAKPSSDAPVRERLLAMMVADGMRPEQALSVFSSAVVSTAGLVVAEHTLNGEAEQERRYQNLKSWSELAADSPVTREAMASSGRFAMQEVFDVTLRSLVLGFEAMAREARLAT